MKTVEQILVALVGIEIYVGVGMPIAGKKFAQTQRLGRVLRAQQNHVTLAAINQLNAAQNERSHEDFA